MKEIVKRELNDLVVAIENGITKHTTRQSLKALARWMKASKSASWINTIVPKEKTRFGELADELAEHDDIIADGEGFLPKGTNVTKYTENIETPAMDRLDALEVHRDRILHDMLGVTHGIDDILDEIKGLKQELHDVHQKVRAVTSAFNNDKRRRNK